MSFAPKHRVPGSTGRLAGGLAGPLLTFLAWHRVGASEHGSPADGVITVRMGLYFNFNRSDSK